MNNESILRKARKDQGLTLEEVAQKVGVTRQEVSAWELRKCVPPTIRLWVLAATLRITTDQILLDIRKHSKRKQKKEQQS